MAAFRLYLSEKHAIPGTFTCSCASQHHADSSLAGHAQKDAQQAVSGTLAFATIQHVKLHMAVALSGAR